MRSQKISPHTIKHIPQRTCVACKEVKAKADLVRLVRRADKRVEIDTEGSKTGRGAYLCRTPECWQLAAKGGRLEHTLRTALSPENREELITFSKNFS